MKNTRFHRTTAFLIAVLLTFAATTCFNPVTNAESTDPFENTCEKIKSFADLSHYDLSRLQQNPDEVFSFSVWFYSPEDQEALIAARSDGTLLSQRNARKEVVAEENEFFSALIEPYCSKIHYVCKYTNIIDAAATYSGIIKICELDCVFFVSILDTDLQIQDCKEALTGDIDSDGSVNAADARLALRFAVQLDRPTAVQAELADFDEDGKITAADARAILRFAVQTGDDF